VYDSGSILDEEVTTTHVKTEQISVGDADVHLNPGNTEGPVVIKYDLNAGKKGFTVEERNGSDVFTVTAAGNVMVENTMYASTVDTNAVLGAAFDKVDNHQAKVEVDTVVLRDGAQGVTNIANLRVRSRRMDGTSYLTNGLCPDNLEPGLFFVDGVCSEQLALREDGRIEKVVETLAGTPEAPTGEMWSYRFGSHPGGTDPAKDGVLFRYRRDSDDAEDSTQLISMTVKENSTNLRVIGNLDSGVTDPLVEFESSEGNQALRVRGGDVEFANDDNTTYFRADSENQRVLVNGAFQLSTETVGQPDNHPVFTSFHGSVPTFTLYADGHMKFLHSFAGGGDPTYSSSIVTDDQSVYIGSCRLSYDRVNHVLTAQRLKTDHVPLYLQGRGFGVDDLPSGHTLNDMSCADWFKWAREHFTEDHLHVHDIFPVANTGDWVVIDAPVPALQAWANGADADITTLETEMDAVEVRVDALEAGGGGGASAPVTESVYVNSSYSGTSDGSSLQPYSTLVAALAAKLSDGSSTKYTFHLAPGTYTGAVSYTFSGNTQSFAIKGAGADCTFVEAASISQNALYFRGFKDIEISDITVQTCLYGIYPRDCKRVVIRNCVMQYCGSDGTAASHNQSGTQAEQAAFWASASTSSGGAARIRECTEVQIQDNTVRYCLRGLRVQDCGSDATASTISNNNCYRTLESSIYLASGSYSGSGGCRSINVVGNTVHEAFNNGILVIGGQHNAIMSNSILRSANAGIQCWSVLDTRVCGNSLFDCNRKSFNGIGNLGDAFGNIVIDGSGGIGTGTYIACLTGNSILKANAGRAGEVRGITLGETIDDPGYPAESGKVQLDANFTDAAVKVSNEQSITITTEALDTRVAAVETKTAGVTEQQLSYLSGATGNIQAQLDAGLGGTAAVASSGAAHFSVSSSAALISGTEQVKMDFVLDRSGTNFDYQYKFHNHAGHLLFTQMQHQRDLGIFSIDEDTACVTIAGGSYINQDCNTTLMRQWTGVPNASLNDLSLHVLGRAAFKNNIRLPLNSTPGSSGDTGTQGDIQIDDDNIWVRNASTWKKAPLVAFDAAASGPGSVVTSTGHENPGGSGSGWPILPDDISLLVVSHSTAGAVRRRMPLSVPNGFSFKIISTSNQGVLNLYHSGASGGEGYFYPGSLGYQNNVMVAINTAVYNPISCFFVDSKWFVVADGTVPVA